MPHQLTTEENKVHSDPQELLPYYEFNRSFAQNQNLDEVTSIAIEAGLKKIITGSQSGALIVWDEETYEKKDEFKVHTDSINCIVTTSSHLFTASDDGTVGVWEKPSMNLLKKLEGHSGWVYSVAIHDKYIFTSSYDGSIKVWDKTSYSLIATWSHHVVSVNSLLVIKDILISGAADGKLFAWKIDDQLLNNPQNQLIGHHSDGISSLCGSEDKDYGLRFYSASHDGVIKVWDFATFQMVREISAGNCVINVSVSRRRIYALTDSGISTFHALTGQLIQSMKIEGTDPRCLSIASDESRAIFVGCSNNTIRNWKAITSSSDAKVDHKGSVLSVWVDEIQCYSSGEDKQILIWDKNTREILATLKGHQRKVNCLYVLDEYLYSASDDGTVIVWNKITHEKVATLEHSKSNVPVSSVVVDAGRIYTQSPFEVIVWNKQSFERISDNQPFFRSPEGRFKGFSVYNGNIYVGCGHDLRISLKIEHTSNQYAPRTFVCDNNIRYVVAKENAIYVGTDKEVLICNAKKNPLEVTSQFKTSGPVNAIVIKYNRIILACGKSPSMTQASPNAAFAPIEIRDSKTGQRVLQSLAGHKGFVYCLYFSEGIIYSGSSDRTVRLWDAQLYDMPAFFQQAMTQELSVQKAEYVDTLDSSKRSALMAAARTGSTANARKLLDLGTKYNFDYISEFGESAIFFALREGHWDFLQEFSTELTIRIRKEDLGSFALMGHRAMAGDYQFFEKLKICNISFPQRSVLDTAIRHNHVIFAKKWTDLSHSYMLHSACFYGRPQCVKALVKRDVDINQKDPKNENRTAVQICHLTARQYSEISEIARIKKEDGKSVKLDIEPIPKERRSKNPDTIYDEYETNLIRRRTECFNIIAGITEISKKPNFTEKDDKNFSSYDQALAMHNYTMIKMKQPRDEQKDREIIQRRNQMFADSSSVLDEYHKDRQVIAVREKYANIMFLKESTIYILYLLILTFVGILCTTNNTTHSYDMGTAVQSYLIGDDFSGVNSAESMFDWLQSSFLPCIYPENENGTHLILKSNLAIGGIQLKQMKIKDNSCKERNLYNADFTDCFAPTLTLKTMDRSSFGPDNRYVFNENKGGDWYWAEDGVWYPPGGFIEVLPTNNSAIATAMIEDLKNNEWVTDGTRAIFVSISLYNGNMNGLFGIVRLSFFFSAIGDVTTDSDVIILSPYSYDRDPASGTVWKILLQFLVVFYILYAFLYTEITEIRESVEESRVFLDLFDEKAVEKKESARWRGLKKYALNAWNIFEWTIISVFFMLFIMELVVVTFWGSLNLHPIPIDYINFQSVAIIMSYQHDLYAFFMLLCWLRLLKFLRIPPYTGPLVQSVLDTLKSTTVIVFVGIVLYIVVVFSLAFHVAFGPDVGAYNNFGNSIMTLVQVLFGNSDFDSLRESNKVFGPLLFLFFMFFIVFVLMNLLVGVLGEAYNNVSEVNSERWNRYITRMMISELDQKLVEPTITFGKLYEKVFGSRRFLDVEAKMNPMTAATDVQPNYQTIYKTDDEMDDIVAKKEYEDLVDNGEDEDEEEEATIEEAKDELVAKIQNLEIANAKTNKKLNEILKLLKSDQ